MRLTYDRNEIRRIFTGIRNCDPPRDRYCEVVPGCDAGGSDPTLEETPMKSITRLVTAVVAVIFAVATLCPAQDVKPADLGKGAAFNSKKIEMKDKGEV